MVRGWLVIQRADRPSEASPSLTLIPFWHGVELAWQRGRVVAVFTPGGKTVVRSGLRRMTEAGYRRQPNERPDQDMRFATLGLYITMQRWQKSHGGSPLSETQKNPGSPLAHLVPGHQWPLSPYSWTPMHQGTQAGDFTYTTDKTTFKLSGHLSGGKDIVAQ